MQALGIITNVPMSASMTSIKVDISMVVKNGIDHKARSNVTEHLVPLEKLKVLPKEKLVIYIQWAKVKRKYINKDIYDNQGVVVYAQSTKVETNKKLLEAYIRGLSILNFRYTPFSVRRIHTKSFVKILCKIMNKRNLYKNVSIYCVSPQTID